MEAAEKTLTYRDDTGLHNQLLKHDKKEEKRKDEPGVKEHRAEKNSNESNYVDLDMRPDGGLKTVKVTFTGGGNQLSVIKSDTCKPERRENSPEDRQRAVLGSLLETLTKLPSHTGLDSDNEQVAELGSSDCSEPMGSEGDELRYTDMCLTSKAESDALSDQCGSSDTMRDESHYITTHEIQLTELDHDVDYDLGRGTWEFEDDNLVYSFVDYASFESDDTQEAALVLEGLSQAALRSDLSGAAVSTQEESELCDSDKGASSDESLCRNESEEPSAGKILLSIKTSSRAVNDSAGSFERAPRWHSGDRSNASFVSSGARAEPLCDRGQYFIPAPGRQHLATKLRRRDINEYSSGASSSISELDDADKEVRNLTAKSFRSLACPYFDAINLSTSSESSVSEYGLNKWSAYVDWNYGNISRGRGERSMIAHRTSSATLEINKTVDNRRRTNCETDINETKNTMCAINKRISSQQTGAYSKKIQMKDRVPLAQRAVTLNLRCNVPNCSKNARSGEVQRTVLARSDCEVQCQQTEDTHKRAIFASSLLKNVISKKMQFEQERKMERGEICDKHPPVSPCFHMRDPEEARASAFTANCPDEQHREGGSPNSSGPPEETKGNKKARDSSETGKDDPLKTPQSHAQTNTLHLLEEDEHQTVKKPDPASVSHSQTTAKEELDTSSVLTKLLFVPSCQLVSKDLAEDLMCSTSDSGAPTASQKCEKELKMVSSEIVEGRGKAEKGEETPEIKICLRNKKENKGCMLNIANLLTPEINHVNRFRAAEGGKSHPLSAIERVPSFTVRDIRDTKCKFQTPIYQVRDVRKLVKSSYRFVSLDSSNSKYSTVADRLDEKVKGEPGKQPLPSPMVIKCNSVKTDIKANTAEAEEVLSQRAPAVVIKQGNPDQSELYSSQGRPRPDKVTGDTAERRNDKQDALEKLKAAVKTMEELYVFDRNEWRRKSQVSHSVADSHVLSLLTGQEQIADEPQTGETPADRRALNVIHVPYSHDSFKTQSPKGKTFTNKSFLHFANTAHIINDSHSKPASSIKGSKTAAGMFSVKIQPQKHSQVESGKNKVSPTVNPGLCSDSENYLTIPGLRHAHEAKLLNREAKSQEGNSSFRRAGTGDSKVSERNTSPLITACPSATSSHHSTAVTSVQKQPQVLSFSPPVPNVSPTPSTGDTVPQTLRKMLLDPSTGHYYLVDTPLQASTKRLLDPETGLYLDVPVPHSLAAPVTPVPFAVSPLSLTAGAYTPTYMVYPSFIPSPSLTAQIVQHSGDVMKSPKSPPLKGITAAAEPVYYSPTGDGQRRSPHLTGALGHVTPRDSLPSTDRKALISITTQQGPRIIAPPSFDGKTMSFVVEHR